MNRIALSLIAVLFVACTSSTTPESPTSKTVGKAGGTVGETGGAEIAIPANALSGDTSITVEKTDPSKLPAQPDTASLAGDAYAFLPHGTTFATPVTVTMPVAADADAIMRLDDAADTTYEIVGGVTIKDGVATFQTTHFSYYVPVSRCTSFCAQGNVGCSPHDVNACKARCTTDAFNPTPACASKVDTLLNCYKDERKSGGFDCSAGYAYPKDTTCGTERAAVEACMGTSTCTSSAMSIITGQPSPPELKKVSDAATYEFDDDFAGPTLNDKLWSVQNDPSATSFVNGALRISGAQQLQFGLIGGPSESEYFEGAFSYDLKLKILSPPADAWWRIGFFLSGQDSDWNFDLQHDNKDATTPYKAVLMQGGSGGNPEAIALANDTSYIVRVARAGTDAVTITVLDATGQTTLWTKSLTSALNQKFYVGINGQAFAQNATGSSDYFEFEDFSSNLQVKYKPRWSLSGSALQKDGVAYGDSPFSMDPLPLWVDIYDKDMVIPIKDDDHSGALSQFKFDGQAQKIRVHLLKVPMDMSTTLKATLYSPLNDADTLTLVTGVGATGIDASADAFERQADGTYKWVLCP